MLDRYIAVSCQHFHLIGICEQCEQDNFLLPVTEVRWQSDPCDTDDILKDAHVKFHLVVFYKVGVLTSLSPLLSHLVHVPNPKKTCTLTPAIFGPIATTFLQ